MGWNLFAHQENALMEANDLVVDKVVILCNLIAVMRSFVMDEVKMSRPMSL